MAAPPASKSWLHSRRVREVDEHERGLAGRLLVEELRTSGHGRTEDLLEDLIHGRSYRPTQLVTCLLLRSARVMRRNRSGAYLR